jgi:hypothetical protein
VAAGDDGPDGGAGDGSGTDDDDEAGEDYHPSRPPHPRGRARLDRMLSNEHIRELEEKVDRAKREFTEERSIKVFLDSILKIDL